MSLLMVLKDYAGWTSMAGVPRIASATSWPVRIFWIAVWVAMFSIAVYQVYLIFAKFLTFPITVQTLLQMKSQEFPVVTICNSNPYKERNLKSGGEFRALDLLMNDYKIMNQNPGEPIPGADTYGINTMKTLYTKNERAQEAQILLANRVTEHLRIQAGYTFNELIKDCSFNDVPCGSADFQQVVDPIYGNCYAFNHNESRMVHRSGMKSGLRVLIYVNLVQPPEFDKTQHLPTTQTIGARVRISGKGVDPAMESYGIPVATGTQTKIGLKLTEIKRMQRPYGICVEKDDRENFYPNHKYSLDVCLRSCSQRRIIAACGCAHPRYGRPESQQTCGTDQLDCLFALRENRTWNPLKECNCNPSCEEVQYDTTISLARYPTAAHDIPVVDSSWGASCKDQYGFFKGNVQSCLKYYHSNVAMLNVFFDTLNSELLQEEPAYPALSAAIELGGQCVLWLGISIISVIEMIGLIIVMVLYACAGRKQKVKPIEDELQKDKRIKDVSELKQEIDKHDEAYKRAKNIGDIWGNRPNP
ncbi:hypothetical protein QR680_007950 [Steinernema hermaphroditum]|uniref:Amiloride-sensitive sodium channel n=1 Tax=Steinernema hermaphroditum TaxID=289476 RepID=A0AA39IEU4_9BILA|nr:hypothetical protein QR680_007950 [Steinernema hermaphroditum]